MKIDQADGAGLPRRPDKPGDAVDSGARAEGNGAPQTDRIQLSPEARLRASLAAAAERVPDVRQERIDALRNEVEQGTYHVEPRRVAEAILEFEDGLDR